MFQIVDKDTNNLIAEVNKKTLVFLLIMVNLAAGVIEERVLKVKNTGEPINLGEHEYDPLLAVGLQTIMDTELSTDGEKMESEVLEHVLGLNIEEVDLRNINQYLNGGNTSGETD